MCIRDSEYTTYFTLQQALNELEDAGLIHKEPSHNSTRYEITREGEETLNFFGKNISPAIVNDMDQYLKENKFRLREEVGTSADYYKATGQDYICLLYTSPPSPEAGDCRSHNTIPGRSGCGFPKFQYSKDVSPAHTGTTANS